MDADGRVRSLAGVRRATRAVHTTVSGFLPEALRRLRERHPDLSIRLVTGLTHELEEQL
jgi:DNA-binding transcriptional LysR family regulator